MLKRTFFRSNTPQNRLGKSFKLGLVICIIFAGVISILAFNSGQNTQPSKVISPLQGDVAEAPQPRQSFEFLQWNPATLQRAAQEQKPILLYIGFPSCMWCHVMERQAFSDPEVKQLMQSQWIAIKVNRDERPDLDQHYLEALRAMNQRPGWPLLVFLTPPPPPPELAPELASKVIPLSTPEILKPSGIIHDGESIKLAINENSSFEVTAVVNPSGPRIVPEQFRFTGDTGLKPFSGTTYMPLHGEDGQMGFLEFLEQQTDQWNTNRPSVLQTAEHIASRMQRRIDNQKNRSRLDIHIPRQAIKQILARYESRFGGFLRRKPKFPWPPGLEFLLLYQDLLNRLETQEPVLHTLDKMAQGGVFDQVGGGFHRFSTDSQWQVPHFEKLTADNARLIQVYALALSMTDDPIRRARYQRVLDKTVNYLFREMRDDETGLYGSGSAAESKGIEGAGYVWSLEELRLALEDDHDYEFAMQIYGFNNGLNRNNPPHDFQASGHVPYLPVSLDQYVSVQGMETQVLVYQLQNLNKQLLRYRHEKHPVVIDSTLIPSTNAQVIRALALAGITMQREDWILSATQSMKSLEDYLIDDSGDLVRAGLPNASAELHTPLFLEDYAFLVSAYLMLHKAQPDQSQWFDKAVILMERIEETFADGEGGYFDTQNTMINNTIFCRTCDLQSPSSVAQMAHNWLDLYEIDGNPNHLERCGRLIASLSADLLRERYTMAHTHHALNRLLVLSGAQVVDTHGTLHMGKP